ncbi:hypothetical protein BV898_15920 [Hypsibius exemplaris]|uniref:Protein quiver n=1 Tax=Hypsibius exemplaris TaxID=2072580 RepID=A0A9X6RKS9_HYPEX|nr:hypothetical protein BV898_15920 [Hypsibius exemplaris]
MASLARPLLILCGLVTLWASSCSADQLKCNMCNSLMGKNGYASDCSKNSDYHAMKCMGPEAYCMKLSGVYTVQNNGTANKDRKFVIEGEQRDCASTYNIGLFYGQNLNGELCADVNRTDVTLTEKQNSDDTYPNMSFVGKVCFCAGNECNMAAGTGSSLAILLSGLVVFTLHRFFI